MKKIIIIAAIAAVALVSCSKDKNEPSYKNAYTYNGETFNIVWAKLYNPPSGYQFAISPTVPAGDIDDELNFFVFECPVEALGKKIEFQNFYYILDWYPYVALNYNGNMYEGADENDWDLSGSDNWAKATKNSGANNFTIEFAMTLDGKRLEGQYTGTFAIVGDWIW